MFFIKFLLLTSSSKFSGNVAKNSFLKFVKKLDITRDLFSIVTNLNDKNYDSIITNLRDLRKNIILDEAISKLELFNKLNKKNIINQLDELELRFELLKYSTSENWNQLNIQKLTPFHLITNLDYNIYSKFHQLFLLKGLPLLRFGQSISIGILDFDSRK